jgi:hypothetical protein
VPVKNFPLDDTDFSFRKCRPNDFHAVQWKNLLAGGENKPLQLSFQRSEDQCGELNYTINRQWDIDSFISYAPSLAVHKGGFSLSYKPPYQRNITQNQRILIKGMKVHKLKHLRLGSGLAAGGYGYQCHVFFPYMALARDGETYLSDAAQAIWVDQIILPALRATVRQDILQHHPVSFADASGKARVMQECFIQSSRSPIDLRGVIPEQDLDLFWTEVIQRANAFSPAGHRLAGQFKDPLLVISGHNLKSFTKRKSSREACADFITHLQGCYNLDIPEVEKLGCWFDLGFEDMPNSTDDPPVALTLLYKTDCLDAWSKKFCSADNRYPYINVNKYHWSTTRDAGSISVELKAKNTLRRNGLMAYNKAYNSHKELFATPLKKHIPFKYHQLEALGYSQELIDRWYTTNSNTTAKSILKREQLIKTLVTTKGRVSTALRGSATYNYSARQEFRVTYGMIQYIATRDSDTHIRQENSSKLTAINLDKLELYIPLLFFKSR